MSAKPWTHESNFLNATAADWLYQRMMQESWRATHGEGAGSAEILFGLSYRQGGGAKDEIPTIPEFLTRLAHKVSLSVATPVNYVQCHKYESSHPVHPHRDPAGMTVPMLTVGQERSGMVRFRILQGEKY